VQDARELNVRKAMAVRTRCDCFCVMPALVAGIHAEPRSIGRRCQAWMAGTSPAMTAVDAARTFGWDRHS
jgi:hypothetical protein